MFYHMVSRAFKVSVFGSWSFFLLILNFSQTYNAYARLTNDVEDFSWLESQIMENLTAITILPSGSSFRRLVDLYIKEVFETSDCQEIYDIAVKEPSTSAKNAACAYSMGRRIKLLHDLSLKRYFRLNFGTLSREIISFFWKYGWPHFEDMELAIQAILEAGFTSRELENFTLDSAHCYEIGNVAMKTGNYLQAIEWLQLAKEKALFDQKASAPFIEFLLWRAIQGYLPESEIPAETESSIDGIRVHKYSFETPHGLKALVKFEWSVYRYIKLNYENLRNIKKGKFREEFDALNEDVRKYLKDFEVSTEKFVGSLDPLQEREAVLINISGNALSAYRTAARFRAFLQSWVRTEPSNDDELMLKIVKFLHKAYDIRDGPSELDYESTKFAILNIQFIYDLPAKDIASGHVIGEDAKVTLNAKDCFEIGKYGVSLKFFTIAFDWLEQALHLVQNNSDDSVKHEEIHDELASAIRMHDEGLPKLTDKTLYFSKPLSKIREPARRVTRKSLQYKALKMNENIYLETKFCGVCNGRIRQTDKMTSRLFCWYEREIHPSFKIGPIKVELHSMYPKAEVVEYHDVISDDVIAALKNFSYKETLQDVTMGIYGVMSRNPLQRIANLPWGNTRDKEVARNASKLISRLTGLETINKTGVEKVRVSAYTPGRFVARHHDKATDLHLATFIFYLSDVDIGGETVFVNARVKVTPKKGSAILWYNRYSCGQLNELTDHGACPAVFGIKWIAVQDIFYDQQDHLQCHPKRRSVYEVLVNGKSKYNIHSQ